LSGDGGCLKKILVEGDASSGTPPPEAKVKVHYVGTLLDGSKFDSSRDRPGFFDFEVGVGRVIKGWDLGISTMHKGEKCVLACRHDYAYGAHGSPPKIPGGATLLFEVELFTWKEKRKPKARMSMEERLREAESLKGRGTEAFKGAKHDDAFELYVDAADYLQEDFAPPEATEDAASTLLISCLLNGATCALKLGYYDSAEELCTKAIQQDGSSVKAHYRRGMARMHMAQFGAAKADLRQASTLDPKSKEVRDGFAECTKNEAASKKSEKAMYAKMF